MYKKAPEGELLIDEVSFDEYVEYCADEHKFWICTRDKGHGKPHAAHGTRDYIHPLAIWWHKRDER